MATTELQMQNFLSAVTDALLSEEIDVESVIRQYEVPRGEVDSLLSVIRRLRTTLVEVQPPRRFTRRLRTDLMGTPELNVVTRIRHLPAGVQIAAGIGLVAGFMLLLRRRFVFPTRQPEPREVPVG